MSVADTSGMRGAWLAFLNLDERLSAGLRLKEQSSLAWFLAVFFAHSGDSWLCAGMLGLVWLVGNPLWRRTSALLLFGVVVQALVIYGVKALIHRERPTGEWGGIYRSVDPHSFPSGHATRAVLLAVMTLSLGPAWLGLVLGVWAPVVGVARVVTGVHYISDVLAGICIGLLMGLGMLALQGGLIQLLPFLF